MYEAPYLVMPKRAFKNRNNIPKIDRVKSKGNQNLFRQKLIRLGFLAKACLKIFLFIIKRPFLAPFSREGLACIQPFYNFEIYPDGQVRTCISTIMTMKIGRIPDRSILRVFNSIEAKLVRISMYEKRYSYCSMSCPVFNEKRFHKIDRKFIETWDFLREDQKQAIINKRLTIKNGPSKITDNANVACNIACEFCFLPIQDKDNSVVSEMTKYILHNKDKIKIIHFCGGEPLLHQSTKKILREYQDFNGCRFEFVTSLAFLDKEMRELLSKISLHYINVSVNAATAQTYQRTIARGDWATVQKNITFISQILGSGKMYMSFVVTKNNFHEIAAFARFARERNAASIHFHTLKKGPEAYWDLGLSALEGWEVLDQLCDPVFFELGEKVQINVFRNYVHGLVGLISIH